MKNLDYIAFEQFAFRHARAIPQLRCPSDIRLAARLQGANCGPAAYAATIECDVLDVMRRFPQFPRKPHTTITQMKAAFAEDGISVHQILGEFPANGVALLQFIGPWGSETTSSIAALKRTHWVGVKGELIYDLNWGAWLPVLSWEAVVYPMFTNFEPRISGWSVRCGLQVGESLRDRKQAQARIGHWAAEWQ